MIIRKVVSVSLATLFMATAAHAEFYVGGNLGVASTGVDALEESLALTAFGGFQIPNNPFFFEAAAIELGDAKIKGSKDKVSINGLSVAAGLRSPRTDSDRLSAYLKVGQYLLNTVVEDADGADDDADSSGFVIAAGFDYPLAKDLYMVGELLGYMDVDLAGVDEGITVYSLGGRYEF